LNNTREIMIGDEVTATCGYGMVTGDFYEEEVTGFVTRLFSEVGSDYVEVGSVFIAMAEDVHIVSDQGFDPIHLGC